ncbi:hypothetical protein Dimus_021253 [Dionaea muscipula]
MRMEELGLVANQHTYTVLINGFFKKDGFWLFEKDERVWNLTQHLCLQLQPECVVQWIGKSCAFLLFDEILERGVTCNVEAEKLTSQMRQRGLSPNLITYNILTTSKFDSLHFDYFQI